MRSIDDQLVGVGDGKATCHCESQGWTTPTTTATTATSQPTTVVSCVERLAVEQLSVLQQDVPDARRCRREKTIMMRRKREDYKARIIANMRIERVISRVAGPTSSKSGPEV